MDDSGIEFVCSGLADGYKKLEKGTSQESSEVCVLRRIRPEYQNLRFYTANLWIVAVLDNTLKCGLSGRKSFDEIAGRDIDGFCSSLAKYGAYPCGRDDLELLTGRLKDDIRWFDPDNLVQKHQEGQYNTIAVHSNELSAADLNPTERALAEKAYGSLDARSLPDQELSDFGETMRMINRYGRPAALIRFPSNRSSHDMVYLSDYGAVAMPCRLGCLYYESVFSAVLDDPCTNVTSSKLGVCGIPVRK